jgi:hypothetical protein
VDQLVVLKRGRSGRRFFIVAGWKFQRSALSAYFKTGLLLIFALSFAYRPTESRDATTSLVLEKLSVSFTTESLHLKLLIMASA